MLCLVAPSLGHLRSVLRFLSVNGAQWICEGVEKVIIPLQERCVTSSKAHKKDHTIATF